MSKLPPKPAPKKVRTPRRVHGAPPRESDQAVLLAVFEGYPCPLVGERWPETWQLWLRPMHSSIRHWWSFKLTSPMWVRAKANYWVSWHATDCRWAEVRDLHKLRTGRPELYRALTELMQSPIQSTIGDYTFDLRIAPRGTMPAPIPLYSYASRGCADRPEATGDEQPESTDKSQSPMSDSGEDLI